MAGKDPLNTNPPFGLFYPIAFFGGVLVLCAWILHGPLASSWHGHHPTHLDHPREDAAPSGAADPIQGGQVVLPQ